MRYINELAQVVQGLSWAYAYFWAIKFREEYP